MDVQLQQNGLYSTTLFKDSKDPIVIKDYTWVKILWMLSPSIYGPHRIDKAWKIGLDPWN